MKLGDEITNTRIQAMKCCFKITAVCFNIVSNVDSMSEIFSDHL